MITLTDELLSKAAYEVDMAILDMLPDPSECEHVFSPVFENKIKKLIRKAKHYIAYKVLKRVACFFIAVVLSACVFVALNPNARAAVVDWVREKVGDFYHYFFVGDNETDEAAATVEPGDVEGNETIADAVGMKDYYLTWVPEGYVLVNSFEADNRVFFLYVDTSGQVMQFTYMNGSDNISMLIGGGDYEERHVAVGNFQAEILLSNDSTDSNAIVWKSEDGNVMFSITSFLEEDDLIKMAQSLVVEEKS